MIKNLLSTTLVLIFTIAISNTGFSQCMPDTAFEIYDLGVFPFPFNENPDNPNFPDSAYVGVTDTVYTGEPWEMTFTAVVPEELDFGGVPTAMEYVRVDAVNGLPNGFIYECSAPNCSYEPGLHCFKVSGTTYSPGVYDITVNISAKLNNVQELPLLIPPDPASNPLNFPEGVYIANVISLTNITEVEEFHEMTNAYPNPMNEKVTLSFNCEKGSNVLLNFIDIDGRTIHSEEINSSSGLNSATVNSSSWSRGIYFYQISDAYSSIQGKVIKK